MHYTDMIAKEANLLPVEKQAEILDFIEFLKTKKHSPSLKTAKDVAKFLRSFDVDTTKYKFDRDEINAR